MNLQSLLEHLRWHGICQADFVIDKKSWTPYLIDLNPRFWGSLVQGIASGVDFPFLYYKIALEGDVAPVNEFKSGVMTRWIGGDLRAFFPLLKETHNKLEFINNFFFPGVGKIFKDDFSINDPLPFFTWHVDAIARVLKNRSFKPVSHDSLEGIWK
jgi:predicted ATP-grasp superfamily ATP-dependent carboligase